MNFVALAFLSFSLRVTGIQGTQPECLKLFSKRCFDKRKTSDWPEGRAEAIKEICSTFISQVLVNVHDIRINGPEGPYAKLNALTMPVANPSAYVDESNGTEVHSQRGYGGVFDKTEFLKDLKTAMNMSINLFEQYILAPRNHELLAIMSQVSAGLKRPGFTKAPPEYIEDSLFRWYRKIHPKAKKRDFLKYYQKIGN